MCLSTFSLQPFPANDLPDVQIVGTLTRHDRGLAIRYALTGKLATLAIAAPSNVPQRRHQLWETTCFEFFLGNHGMSSYWEFNLSPAGHWNVYRFRDYRQGMTAETTFVDLPFCVESGASGLTIAIDLSLERLGCAAVPLDIAIAVVLETASGAMSYWDLSPPDDAPDFHRRDRWRVC